MDAFLHLLQLLLLWPGFLDHPLELFVLLMQEVIFDLGLSDRCQDSHEPKSEESFKDLTIILEEEVILKYLNLNRKR